ncbi:hypothetical protein QUB68_15205 [Microcoleus sp. A006_D1]|uniref:hypothetical protein n=1 Tax=Microcoleus sp. A006_D1 TaxID=3055267 RepID=UPI002FD4A5BE
MDISFDNLPALNDELWGDILISERVASGIRAGDRTCHLFFLLLAIANINVSSIKCASSYLWAGC